MIMFKHFYINEEGERESSTDLVQVLEEKWRKKDDDTCLWMFSFYSSKNSHSSLSPSGVLVSKRNKGEKKMNEEMGRRGKESEERGEKVPCW